MNLFFVSLLLLFQTGFYTLSFQTTTGGVQAMNAYRGRAVVLVNIATESPFAGQLSQLQALQQRFGDSLVVLAFPSNSFGHEPKADSVLRLECVQRYGVTYTLAKKAAVRGSGRQPVYDWLSSSNENGSLEGEVAGDFQKYLVNAAGELVGVFAPKVSPLDATLINAIRRSF